MRKYSSASMCRTPSGRRKTIPSERGCGIMPPFDAAEGPCGEAIDRSSQYHDHNDDNDPESAHRRNSRKRYVERKGAEVKIILTFGERPTVECPRNRSRRKRRSRLHGLELKQIAVVERYHYISENSRRAQQSCRKHHGQSKYCYR